MEMENEREIPPENESATLDPVAVIPEIEKEPEVQEPKVQEPEAQEPEVQESDSQVSRHSKKSAS